MQRIERIFDKREATEFLEKTDALNDFLVSTCQNVLATTTSECEAKVINQLNRLRDPLYYLPKIEVLRDEIIKIPTLAKSVDEQLEAKLGMSFEELALKVNEIKSLQRCFFEIQELQSLVNDVPLELSLIHI